MENSSRSAPRPRRSLPTSAAEEDGHVRVRASQVQQPAVSDQQQDQNAPDQVVNMHSVHDHPLEMTLMIHNSVNQDRTPAKVSKKATDAMNMRRRGRSGMVERTRYPSRVNCSRISRTTATRLAKANKRSAPVPSIAY